MSDTDNSVALVTGAGSGIGQAIASRLADNWTVYATDVETAGLDELPDCETYRLDVTDDASVDGVVARARRSHGGIDVLVNNAGYAELGPVEDVPVDAVTEQFDVNVFGPLRLCRAVLPGMRERGRGHVVNVSSIFGWTVLPGTGAYSASKFGVEALSDALRRELLGTDIDVSVVEPAWVRSGFAGTARAGLADRARTPAYDAVYALLERTPFLDGAALAVSPATVAEVVHTAVTAREPESRYPVGPQARLLRATGWLPDAVMDPVARGLLAVADRLAESED